MKFPFFKGLSARRKSSSKTKASRRQSFLRRGMVAEQLEERALFATVNFRLDAVALTTPAIPHTDGVNEIHPGQTGSNYQDLQQATNPSGIATIDKGTAFELRIYVRDTQAGYGGIFSAPLDMLLDSSKVAPVINEKQDVVFQTTAGDFTGGTLTVSYGGNTATATWDADDLFFTQSLQIAVRQVVGSSNVDFVQIPQDTEDPNSERYHWEARFKGALEGQNVEGLTFNLSGLTGGGTKNVVVNQYDGDFNGAATSDIALNDSFKPSTAVEIVSGQRIYYASLGSQTSYTDNPSGLDRIEDIFAAGSTTGNPEPGRFEREYVFVKIIARDGTDGVATTFQLAESDQDFIYRLNPDPNDNFKVDPMDVSYGSAFQLIIKEYVSAKADLINASRATDVGGGVYQLNVFNDNGSGQDVSDADAGANKAFTINSVSATTYPGSTVTRSSDNKSVRYTPPAGFMIAPAGVTTGIVQDTFTYSILTTQTANQSNPAYADTATVTVNLIAPNLPPMNIGLPTSAALTEGDSLTIPANTLMISDPDTSGGNVTVTFTTTNASNVAVPGILKIGGVQQGSAGSTFTFTDTVDNINTLFEGDFEFTPTDSNFNGTLNFKMTTDDLGSGLGSSLTDVDTLVATFAAVNDPPVVTVIGDTTITEEDTLPLSGLHVDDVDLAEGNLDHLMDVTIQANRNSDSTGYGTFSYTAGSSSVIVDSAGQLVLRGTIAALNTTLGTLVYLPDISHLGQYTFSVTADDRGNSPLPAQVVTETFNVNITQSTRPVAVDDRYEGLVAGYEAAFEDQVFDLPTSVLANDKSHAGETKYVVDNGGEFYSNLVIKTATGQIVSPPPFFVTYNDQTTLFTLDLPALADFYGTVEFDYEMSDTAGNDSGADVIGHVYVLVNNVNDPPSRVISTPLNLTDGIEDQDYTFDLSSYFTDVDGDPLTVEIVSEGPETGSLISNAIGSVTYRPPTDFVGTQTLTFRASDGQSNSGDVNVVTVNITYAAVNDPPTTSTKSININEDSIDNALSIADVVKDVDNALSEITIININSDKGGTFGPLGTVDQDFTFTPPANFNSAQGGVIVLTYTISDPAGGTTVGTINVTVDAANDKPIANDDSGATYTIGEGQTKDFNITANDSDLDASATFQDVAGLIEANSTITIVTGPVDGSNTPTGTASIVNGKLRYVAPATIPAQTTVTITYTITDPGGLTSDPATVTISLQPTNDPPTASNFSLSVTEDVNKTFNIFDLGGVSDPDTPRSSWTVEIVTQPSHGTLVAGSDGSYTYRPAANYNGTDSFTYRINDNSSIAPINQKSPTRTVSINVSEVNDPPVANDDSQANGAVGQIINNANNNLVNEIDVLANDRYGVDSPSVDGTLKIIAFGSSNGNPNDHHTAKGGTLSLVNGKILYKAPAGLGNGTDSFVYTIADRNGNGLTDTATVTFSVQEALPVDVNVSVYQDERLRPRAQWGNGRRDAGEKGYQHVAVVLVGHDLNGKNVRLVQRTDVNGNLTFSQLLPGKYVVREVQPRFTVDGREYSPDIKKGSNDVRYLRAKDWFKLNLPSVPSAGNDTTIDLYFGEMGLPPRLVSIEDTLTSSSPNGLLLAVSKNSRTLWNQVMGGWTNVQDVTARLSANQQRLRLIIKDDNGNNTVKVLTRTGNQQFRILGTDRQGNILIRIDGKAKDFGLPKFAQSESQSSTYEDNADLFFGSLL